MKRIDNLRKILPDFNVDFLIIENPIDVFYLTGFTFSRARLVIGKDREILFLDGRYIDSAKELFPCDSLSDKNLKVFLDLPNIRVGFDSIFTNVHDFEKFEALFAKKIELISIKNPLKGLRMVKDAKEITLLKESANLNWKAFEHARSFLTPGVTEKEIALEIELFFRKNGAEKLAFDPIIAFGENSAFPHYIPSNVPMKKTDVVLIDMGCIYNRYHSDMTRMVMPSGVDAEMQNIYDHVRKAHKLALSFCKPGTKLGHVDEAVHRYFKQVGMDHLMKHSLGHGVGLEIHESPSIKFDGEDRDILLKPGMVFTIEPGLYKKGLGGVRYEDTLLVTSDGIKNFYD